MEIDIGNPDQLKTAFNAAFAQLGVQVDDAFQKTLDDIGKEAVKRLKNESPKGSGSKRGHYKDGWRYKRANVKKGLFSATIYNATKPGLTHLLENKHEKKDRAGNSHGYSDAQPHISKVNEWVQAELPKRLKQNISK